MTNNSIKMFKNLKRVTKEYLAIANAQNSDLEVSKWQTILYMIEFIEKEENRHFD